MNKPKLTILVVPVGVRGSVGASCRSAMRDREIDMRHTLRAMTVCALLGMFPLAARAQTSDGRRVEIGAGVGTVGSWWSGPFSGGDVRISVPVSARGDVETLLAVSPSGGETIGFYGMQFRQRLRHATSELEPFLTYGGIGIFYRDGGESMVTPPFIGLVGGGVERRIHRLLSVRVEAQAMVAFIVPVGVRVAAGVSVPIGRARMATR